MFAVIGKPSTLIVFFFLDVRTAFSTGKTAPHPFGGLVQAAVVVWAREIADPLAFFAHHRIGAVLIDSFRLDRLAPGAFFLGHEQNLLSNILQTYYNLSIFRV